MVAKEVATMHYENPFTPSFGEIPAHMAGRRQIVADFERAFKSTSRRPELTSIISGPRGVGKTALLSLLSNKAQASGWIAVNTTALPGMLDDVEIGLRRNASHLLGGSLKKRLSGVEVAAVGSISFESAEPEKTNWRYRMTDMLDELQKSEIGLVVTIDEIDPTLDELVELAAVFQHFVLEGYKVSLLMAGLPHNVSTLLNNKTVSFLRRAQHYKLGRIADHDVKEALWRTISENGREIDGGALDLAVEGIEGFPFLMQLVGYRSWDVSDEAKSISAHDVALGIDLAKAELEDRIFGATYRELSPGDIRFLTAMLEDGEESKISDLVERLDRSPAQVSQYRRRLIDAGVIGERTRGVIGFDLPYFREFLSDREGVE